MLFALVASSLVFANVNAGEMTLSGSMEVALTKVDGETGNPIGLENEMDITGSTELDNGIGVAYKMTIDATTFDDEELVFSTPYGTLAVASTGGPLDANDNIVPTAFEEAEYGVTGTSYIDVSKFSGNGAMALRYGNTFYGVGVDAMYTPRYGSGDGSDDGSPSGTANGEYGAVEEIVLSADPLGMLGIDGSAVKVGYGKVESLESTRSDPESALVAVTYAYGPLSVGLQKSGVLYGEDGTSRTTGDVIYARNTNVGAAFAVNDNLSISYQETESLRKSIGGIEGVASVGGSGTNSKTLKADTISVAYTIGGLSIKYADSEVDQDAYTASTNSTATTLSIGVMAFVVQDAAEKIFSFSTSISWLIPKTIFGIFFPGAVNKTFETPFELRCNFRL